MRQLNIWTNAKTTAMWILLSKEIEMMTVSFEHVPVYKYHLYKIGNKHNER